MAAMSNFTLSEATISDLPGIAKVSRAAFHDSQHTISYWAFSQNNETANYEWRLNRITNTFKDMPHCKYTKVVDTTEGRIVAFALWEAPHKSENETESTKKEQGKKEDGDKGDGLPEVTNVQLLHDFEAETQRMRAKYCDKEKDYSE